MIPASDKIQNKELNNVVAKKIGVVASGNLRQSNRNQMMKNNQNAH